MKLIGVTVHGIELAEILAVLLQRHGYINHEPVDLDALLADGRNAITGQVKTASVLVPKVDIP